MVPESGRGGRGGGGLDALFSGGRMSIGNGGIAGTASTPLEGAVRGRCSGTPSHISPCSTGREAGTFRSCRCSHCFAPSCLTLGPVDVMLVLGAVMAVHCSWRTVGEEVVRRAMLEVRRLRRVYCNAHKLLKALFSHLRRQVRCQSAIVLIWKPRTASEAATPRLQACSSFSIQPTTWTSSLTITSTILLRMRNTARAGALFTFMSLQETVHQNGYMNMPFNTAGVFLSRAVHAISC